MFQASTPVQLFGFLITKTLGNPSQHYKPKTMKSLGKVLLTYLVCFITCLDLYFNDSKPQYIWLPLEPQFLPNFLGWSLSLWSKKGITNQTCFQTCLNRKKPILINATKHHKYPSTQATKLLRKGHPKLITMQRQRARLTNHRREAVKYSSPSESNDLIHKRTSELMIFAGGWILIHGLCSLVYTVSIYLDKLDVHL